MAGEESIAYAQRSLAEIPAAAKTHLVEMPPSPETESTTAPISEQTSVLQNNEEYMLVYRAIQALKSQLDRAKNDMDILIQLRDQALAKPQKYIQSLTDGTAAAAPRQQAVAMIPSVYIDPYIAFADSTAIDAYMQCIRIQAQRGDELQASSELFKPTNSTVQPLSLGARTPVTTKAGKSASALHPFVAPNSANIGLLTGVTAVATPEQSPKRTQSATDMVRVAVAGEGSGGGRGAKHSSVSPTGTAPMTATSVHSAQIDKSVKAVTELRQMNRANTEPVPRPAASAAAADSAATSAASIPVSPVSRGKSQKTLTPQILEAFRRQISEERSLSPAQHNHEPGPFSDNFEDDDDDDEYYNQLQQQQKKKQMPLPESGEIRPATKKIPHQARHIHSIANDDDEEEEGEEGELEEHADEEEEGEVGYAFGNGRNTNTTSIPEESSDSDGEAL
ncbi:hypothetical protein GGF37_005512, partial [Kickxella alabastrina]